MQAWTAGPEGSIAKVDYKLDYLVVRTLEEVKRVHLSEERLVIL